MVVGLVPPEEQERIYQKLVAYYQGLYPGVSFSREEKELSRDEIGELQYTYPGEENQATAAEKIRMINSAIGEGYKTPIIVLKVKDRMILLDGHRRVRVAYAQGMAWKALLMVPDKEVKFGIEDMVLGKVKDLYGK